MFFYRMRRVFMAMTLSSVGVYVVYLGGGGFEEKVYFSLLKNPDIYYKDKMNVLSYYIVYVMSII